MKKLGFKVDFEVTREFLDRALYPKDYFSTRVLMDYRLVELFVMNGNILIEGPEIVDISDRTKGMRAGDLYKYTWFVTSMEK